MPHDMRGRPPTVEQRTTDAARDHTFKPTCPRCGNANVPELMEPSGLAFCPRCGSFLRRSAGRLVQVGVSTDALSELVRGRLSDQSVTLERIRQRIRARLAERLGVELSAVSLDQELGGRLVGDSLDIVELVMAIEEEFGIEIDSL